MPLRAAAPGCPGRGGCSFRASERTTAYACAVALVRDDAIVLRVWDWSETSQTAALFCRERGLLRGLAKGSRREKGRFSGGLEVATRGEVVAIVKSGAELATLTDWDLQEVFRRLRMDLLAHHAGLASVDVVMGFLTDEDPHPALFDALLGALRAIDGGETPVGALLALQWSALAEAGYAPELGGELPAGGAIGFDPSVARFVPDPGPAASDQGAGVWRVRSETARRLRELARGEPVAGGASNEVLRRASLLLASYSHWVLGRASAGLAAFLALPVDPGNAGPSGCPASRRPR